jgi:hypothetical protein
MGLDLLGSSASHIQAEPAEETAREINARAHSFADDVCGLSAAWERLRGRVIRRRVR